MKAAIVVLNFILLANAVGAELHCRGSDGPTPFTNIQQPIQELVHTTDSVKSFVILEKRNQLAYVGSKGHLWLYNFEDQSELNLGKFRGPLASVIDPEERFLVSGKAGLLKDLRAYTESPELRIPNSAEPVFWYQKELFLIEKMNRIAPGNWSLTFSKVNSDYGVLKQQTCRFSLDANIELGVGQGHVFPYLLLYGFRPQKGGSHLDLYHVNLISPSKDCDIRLVAHYQNPIRGKVVSVTQLKQASQYAILTDHDEQNLLYDQGKTCRYFKVPNGVSYFPNPVHPILLNINRQRGVGVFSLETGKQFTLDRPVDVELTFKSHVWINSISPDMFIAFKDKGNNFQRRLYHLGLENLSN